MPKVAQCQCGSLRASLEGEHEAVVACSCLGCQRRTGSVLGVGAYFPRDRVSITGEAREYVRTADSGYELLAHRPDPAARPPADRASTPRVLSS